MLIGLVSRSFPITARVCRSLSLRGKGLQKRAPASVYPATLPASASAPRNSRQVSEAAAWARAAEAGASAAGAAAVNSAGLVGSNFANLEGVSGCGCRWRLRFRAFVRLSCKGRFLVFGKRVPLLVRCGDSGHFRNLCTSCCFCKCILVAYCSQRPGKNLPPR